MSASRCFECIPGSFKRNLSRERVAHLAHWWMRGEHLGEILAS